MEELDKLAAAFADGGYQADGADLDEHAHQLNGSPIVQQAPRARIFGTRRS